MAKTAFLLVALACVFFSIESANAFECYKCAYADGASEGDFEGFNFDKSCQSGKKPKKDYQSACTEMDLILFPRAELETLGVNTTGIDIQAILPKQGTTEFACGKVYLEDGTLRGCVPKYPNVGDVCEEDKKLSEIAERNDKWGEFAQFLLVNAGNTTVDAACVCTGVNCNSAFTTTFSLTLLFASVGLVLAKNSL